MIFVERQRLRWGIGMAIKDRDGKVYVLRGPNPLLNEQQEWDKSRVRFFNIGVRVREVINDARNPVEAFNENVIDIGKELNLKKSEPEPRAKIVPAKKFIEEIQSEPVIEKQITPVEEIKPEPIVLNVDQKTARLLKERGVEYYCAPALGRQIHRDDFYDNSYSTINYGEKFVFDAIIVDESDFELQFWCIKPITVDSIVYRKIQKGGERWWRIKESEPKSGGYLLRAITSDSNPDFT